MYVVVRALLVPSGWECWGALPVHKKQGVDVSSELVRMEDQELEASGSNQSSREGRTSGLRDWTQETLFRCESVAYVTGIMN